jgi:hypothetical protein
MPNPSIHPKSNYKTLNLMRRKDIKIEQGVSIEDALFSAANLLKFAEGHKVD